MERSSSTGEPWVRCHRHRGRSVWLRGGNGSFSKRSLTSQECAGILNALLGLKQKGDVKVSSHSLKTTLLAWAARYGLNERTRTLLGHHSLQGDSLACYSRDVLSGPTRDLCGMLLNIRNQKFNPDSTRSGWLAENLDELRIVQVQTADKPLDAFRVEEHARSDDNYSMSPPSRVADPSEGRALGAAPDDELEVPGFVDQVANLDSEENLGSEVDDFAKAPNLGSFLEPPENGVEDSPWHRVGETAGDFEEFETQGPLARLREPQNISGNQQASEDEEHNEVIGSASSASSEDEDSSWEAPQANEEKFIFRQMNEALYAPRPVIAGRLLQNNKSKMLHRCSDEDPSLTRCGVGGDNFIYFGNGTLVSWPKCSKCFKHEVEDLAEGANEALGAAKRRRVSWFLHAREKWVLWHLTLWRVCCGRKFWSRKLELVAEVFFLSRNACCGKFHAVACLWRCGAVLWHKTRSTWEKALNVSWDCLFVWVLCYFGRLSISCSDPWRPPRHQPLIALLPSGSMLGSLDWLRSSLMGWLMEE